MGGRLMAAEGCGVDVARRGQAGAPDKKLMPGAQQHKQAPPAGQLGPSSHSKIQGEAGCGRVVLGQARPNAPEDPCN